MAPVHPVCTEPCCCYCCAAAVLLLCCCCHACSENLERDLAVWRGMAPLQSASLLTLTDNIAGIEPPRYGPLVKLVVVHNGTLLFPDRPDKGGTGCPPTAGGSDCDPQVCVGEGGGGGVRVAGGGVGAL